MCQRGKQCQCKRKQLVNKTTKFKHQAVRTRKRLPQGAPVPPPKRSAKTNSRGQSGSKSSSPTTRRGRPKSKNQNHSSSEPHKKIKKNLEKDSPATSEKCVQVDEPENKCFSAWASEIAFYYLQRLTSIYSSASTRKKRRVSCCSCHPLINANNAPNKTSFKKLRLCVNECQPRCQCKAQQVVMLALQFGEDQGILQKMEGDQTLYKLKRHVSFCLPTEEDIRDRDQLDQDIRRKRRRTPEQLGLDESQENAEDYWKVRQHVRNNSTLYPCWSRRDSSYQKTEKHLTPIIKQPTPSPPAPPKSSREEVSYIK